MARPLLKKNLARPPGTERKIDIALTQDWATLSRRARANTLACSSRPLMRAVVFGRSCRRAANPIWLG
jgi:hypothetical protein